eukprot:scaffold27697_cov51-Isochrysis_galbana.AAC.1
MRYAPPRLLSPGRDPLEDGGLGGCHMQDGDAVGRVLGADRSEDVLVPAAGAGRLLSRPGVTAGVTAGETARACRAGSRDLAPP